MARLAVSGGSYLTPIPESVCELCLAIRASPIEGCPWALGPLLPVRLVPDVSL